MKTLPPRVHLKHGAYYYVRLNEWRRLCAEGEDVHAALAAMGPFVPKQDRLIELVSFVPKLHARCRNNARGRRSIGFTLLVEDVYRMLDEQGWVCAVTRHDFSFVQIAGKRPFAPSIDRIDSAQGYSRENCRVVCVATNYAMNVWGEEVFRSLLEKYRSATAGASKRL